MIYPPGTEHLWKTETQTVTSLERIPVVDQAIELAALIPDCPQAKELLKTMAVLMTTASTFVVVKPSKLTAPP